MSRKSGVVLQLGESIWMLKSPKSNMEDVYEKSCVMSSAKSDKNDGLGLGGR